MTNNSVGSITADPAGSILTRGKGSLRSRRLKAVTREKGERDGEFSSTTRETERRGRIEKRETRGGHNDGRVLDTLDDISIFI